MTNLLKKRKKKRINLHPPVPKPKPPVKTADAVVLSIVNLVGFFIATVGVVLSGWAGYDTVTHKYRPSFLLAIATLSWCGLIWVTAKLGKRAMKILKQPLWEKSAKELKRIQILMLSLQPFILFTTAMPLLYSYGYVARFSNWLFGLVITSVAFRK